MSARAVIAIVVVVALGIGAIALWRARQPEDTAWRSYKERFVAADGRVIDTGNKNVSHTEGQGYAMLFAVAAHDRATFDRVWMWTRDTLRRPDGLFSWRYVPDAANPITDRNNATDGDLMICWALLRASQTWNEPSYRNAALTLATALHAVVAADGDDAYLLPGVDGFVADGKRVVNLSYWVFPALQDIATATGDPVWARVIATGLKLIEHARFGEHQLPPDWLETSGALRPADGFPPRFGYDAVRIPLYVAWSGLATPARVGAIANFWASATTKDGTPAWVDVTSGAVSPEKQSPGMAAVARLTEDVAGLKPPTLPASAHDDGDYYSTSLSMLAKLAEQKHAPR